MVYPFIFSELRTLLAMDHLLSVSCPVQHSVLLLEIPDRLVKKFTGFGRNQSDHLDL